METTKKAWHSQSVDQVERDLGATPATGLTAAEAGQRLAIYGPNRPPSTPPVSFWQAYLKELQEPMILLLFGTGLLYLVWGEFSDALTIFVVILTLNTIEVLNEDRARKAIAALHRLAEPTALVRREGQASEVPGDQVVPGDVVLLQAGRRVPADALLIEAFGLAVDESVLTGESAPVDKQAGLTLPAETPLAERRNMAYSGTVITRGRGVAVVVGTGSQTELGHIAGLAAEVKPRRTPLQVAMKELSGKLVYVALGLATLVPLLGWQVGGQDARQMLLTGLSLAFAVIPEELPIIITLVLALGAYHLSRNKAIVKDLQAVETLGAVTVIATDKTGTLTENHMHVDSLYPPEEKERLLRTGVLASDAVGGVAETDPLERALSEAAGEAGQKAVQAAQRRTEFSFDNERKMMSMVYQRDGGLWVAVKGAPEAVLAQSTNVATDGSTVPLDDATRARWLDQTQTMAAAGQRVLAVAEKSLPDGEPSRESAESGLTLVGLVGLVDPPRPEAKGAIRASQEAGIRTIMVTGDHPATARRIAADVGMDGDGAVLTGSQLDGLNDTQLGQELQRVSLFARATPQLKLRLVQALQARGERVAVTGDGVNDAPALVAADIGVAMGQMGTDVAREAADIVLADDNINTIVGAVREGRKLFANLSKGVRYYLSCKVALVLITLLPTLLHVPMPFAPVQIILMELFMDLAAAASFAGEKAEGDLMKQGPRDPRAKFMDARMLESIGLAGLSLAVAVSAAYLWVWYGGADVTTAQTTAFAGWLVGHVVLAFMMRSERQPLLQMGIFSNRAMVAWAIAAVSFALIAIYVPLAQGALKTAPLTLRQWEFIVVASLLSIGWIEVRKLLTYGRR